MPKGCDLTHTDQLPRYHPVRWRLASTRSQTLTQLSTCARVEVSLHMRCTPRCSRLSSPSMCAAWAAGSAPQCSIHREDPRGDLRLTTLDG